jgi:hypothetical protein
MGRGIRIERAMGDKAVSDRRMDRRLHVLAWSPRRKVPLAVPSSASVVAVVAVVAMEGKREWGECDIRSAVELVE